VRHELLPYLDQHFNPQSRRALARLADAARADDSLLARHAATVASAAVKADTDGVRLESAVLATVPEAIARRVVQHALVAAGESAPDAEAVAAVLDVWRGERSAADAGSLRVEPFGQFVVLVRRDAARPPAPFCVPLPVPGKVLVQDAGWILEALGPLEQPRPKVVTGHAAQIDADKVAGGLVVRSRQPGDRLQPAGLGGSKKIQDIFVDRKVPRVERDRVPIVTDVGGRIVWVAGHVIAEEFRVTEVTKAVIILKLRRI